MDQLVLFKSSGIQSKEVVYVLLAIAVVTGIIIYLSYRYQRFKKFREFMDEVEMLDLGNEEEDTLSNMVKQYALKEPVQILVSLRLFDEMATKEISRILASAGSAAAKQKFVDLVYEIRKKTYYKESSLSRTPVNLSTSQEKEPAAASETA